MPMISECACCEIWRTSVRRYPSGIQSFGSIFSSAATRASKRASFSASSGRDGLAVSVVLRAWVYMQESGKRRMAGRDTTTRRAGRTDQSSTLNRTAEGCAMGVWEQTFPLSTLRHVLQRWRSACRIGRGWPQPARNLVATARSSMITCKARTLRRRSLFSDRMRTIERPKGSGQTGSASGAGVAASLVTTGAKNRL